MNGFCLKCFSIEMYNFEIFIVFPLHMLKVLRYCNVKYRALALAYLNIEILALTDTLYRVYIHHDDE